MCSNCRKYKQLDSDGATWQGCSLGRAVDKTKHLPHLGLCQNKKNTVGNIIPKKHLPLSDKGLTQVRCAKKALKRLIAQWFAFGLIISFTWDKIVTGCDTYMYPVRIATTTGS